MRPIEMFTAFFCVLAFAGCARYGYGDHVDSRKTKKHSEVDDAAAADSGIGSTSENCPERPGVLFCSGFEAGFERWSYDVATNGELTLTDERARTGTMALLATTGPPGEGTQARWATEVLANQKSGDAWMRFYNWVPKSVKVTKHFSVGVMSESEIPYDGFELRILPDGIDINSTAGVFAAKKPFPRDKWVCVELHVFIHPTDGIYEAYLDGERLILSKKANTVPADGFTAAEIGVHYADPDQGPVEVFVDDVAVGTTRIPCEPAL